MERFRLARAQRRFLVSLVLTVLCCACGPSAARAVLLIEAPDIVAAPGTSGEFDILIRNTGSDTIEISSFTLQLTLEGVSGALFNAPPTINTASQAYVFVDSIVAMGLVDFSTDSFPTDSFVAADTEFADPFFRAIAPGEVFGLARVSFEIDSSASGTWRLSIRPGTSFADAQGNLITFSTRNGSISTVAPIPEPTSAALMLVGLTIAAAGSRPRVVGLRRTRSGR